MSKGMISNYVRGDDYLIDNYDTMIVALSFGIDPSIVESWTEEKMGWAKTTIKVKNQIEGGKN